jgi:hypothetical protein
VIATGQMEVFFPSSETNGRPEVADAICLGAGRRQKLNKVIVDLDVLPLHLRVKSSESHLAEVIS